MDRPNFKPIFTQKSDFCEKSSPKPVKTFVPHQAISISDLIQRFERGQRLNVHSNFKPGSNFEDITDEQAFDQIRNESMDSDDFPPVGVHDVVDVESEMQAHEIHKREFQERQKKKKEEAQQAAQSKAKPANDPTPPDPAA